MLHGMKLIFTVQRLINDKLDLLTKKETHSQTSLRVLSLLTLLGSKILTEYATASIVHEVKLDRRARDGAQTISWSVGISFLTFQWLIW